MIMLTHFSILNISFNVNFPFKYSNIYVPIWLQSGEGGGGRGGRGEGFAHLKMY